MCGLWHVVVLIGLVKCSYSLLAMETNMVKPRFDSNKVNKGVWLRKNRKEPFVKSNLAAFFRANSLDAESQVQIGLDPFSSKQDGAASAFMGRYKREPHSITNRRYRKSFNNDSKQNTSSVLSNGIAPFRDSSNNKNIVDYDVYTKSTTNVPVNQASDKKGAATENKANVIKQTTKQKDKQKEATFEYIHDIKNWTEGNVPVPKRSMNYASENNRIDLYKAANIDSNTNSDVIPIINDRDGSAWQIAPVNDVVYEIVQKEPKDDVKYSKPVSERGLIKVLSMLTKTFKKIMKQHNDIKTIVGQINNISEECKTNIEKHSKRLEDFDAKYAFFLKAIEKLKTLQDKLKTKEEGYKKREEEMSKYLLKLEKQQKTFLAQQQQFFSVQKLLLAQNEKINQKQNSIAKTQNDIALKQSNFARLLERAKKIYSESKHPQFIATVASKNKYSHNVTEEKKTNEKPATSTESIKINLFSIPSENPIQNQDELILRDIDEKNVDDLIYKYYFNNTFIDNIIKKKILPGFFITDKTAIARNAKQKRNKHKATFKKSTNTSLVSSGPNLDKTILLPVYNETNNNATIKRERRWINHHSKRKHRRKHHGKGNFIPIRQPTQLNEGNSVKNETSTTVKPSLTVDVTTTTVKVNSVANDPFSKMATHFCIEIRQNSTEQILNWCIEKALRKLKALDTKLVPAPPEIANSVQKTSQAPKKVSSYLPIQTEVTNSLKLIVTVAPTVSTSVTTGSVTDSNSNIPKTATLSEFNAFFPDNDELEMNLKQFDLTKDPIGNVYYDGSLHESDIAVDESDAPSDFMPGFESNSRVDLDTRMMDLQRIRQFHNQRVKNMMHTQKKLY